MSRLAAFSGLLTATTLLVSQLALAEGRMQLTAPTKPVEVGDNLFTVEVESEQGKPLEAKSLRLLASMPPMGTMPYMESEADLKQTSPGRFQASLELTMGGTWDLTLSANLGGENRSLRYTVTTGIAGIVSKSSEGVATATKPKEGTSTLNLGPARLQRIGVKMGAVKREPLVKMLRAAGVVEADPSARAEVSLRIPGYLQKTFNHRVGEQIHAGDTLAEIFSPDLVAAQNEFLLGGHLLGVNHQNPAGSERLSNLGMGKADIARLMATKKPIERVAITAPISGTILEVNAREGSKAESGQVLFVIGNLQKSYIIAKVFQPDVKNLKPGMPAIFSIPGETGEPLQAEVDLVFPTTSDPTGLTDVRLLIRSKSAALKPGQFVDVEFTLSQREALALPVDAILYSGRHTYVFREVTPGILEAVEVVTGTRAGDRVAILSGLSEGDRVALSGTFLLSSEANLRSALPKWKSSSVPTP
jgi:Cu(I)/Ag(I) efflux system membrane fusion protein